MTNNSYNEYIEITFNCIQPISINNEIYSKLITSKFDIDKVEKSANDDYKTQWLSEFSSKNNVYNYMYSVKKNNAVDSILLQEELNNKNNYLNNINLSEFLLVDNTSYELILDFRFLYFILIYEIKFKIPIDIIEILLKGNENNLYNFVRKLFVKEDDNSEISNWVTQTRKQSFLDIENFSKNFKEPITSNNLSIKNNTGNITNIVYYEKYNKDELVQKFIQCNENSERLKVTTEAIYQDEKVSYSFYGRFHTIVVKNRGDTLRYMPIQFHMQYLWFLLNYYNNIMDKLNIEFMDKKQNTNIDFNNDLIDELINKIEMLVMHNERFSAAIEIDNELIYKKIEKKWNIFLSLNNSKQYITFFKDYLERTFTKKIVKSQKKQNRILFAISFLQIAALISVWNDYLSLLNEDNIKNIDEILFIFYNKKENLMLFNEYIPFSLFAFTIASIIYLVIKKR